MMSPAVNSGLERRILMGLMVRAATLTLRIAATTRSIDVDRVSPCSIVCLTA
jgi:hypothetical protein